jgi:hypothetical protein
MKIFVKQVFNEHTPLKHGRTTNWIFSITIPNKKSTTPVKGMVLFFYILAVILTICTITN